MRVFVLFMLLLMVVAVAAFISLNHAQAVPTIALGFTIVENTTLNMVVSVAFGLGIMWSLIIFIMQEIRMRVKMSRLKSTIKSMQAELDNLRTMPLDDIEFDEEDAL